MASRQSCGCSPREKDSLKSVAREHDISSAVILSNFVGMPSYPADFRKSRAERSFLTSSCGDDFLQFASDDARHANL